MELYSHLFSRAYADLLGKQEEKNYLTPAELEVGRFVSLDNYFAHMGDLFEINPKYLMLPLDETSEALFKIDANTRKVTIPKPFDSCSGIQTDNMCEIIVFTIDRYFDYQDLSDLNICVQWIRPGGTPDDEGISHIRMIDLETYPGQLRFGWPLTSEITKYPGKVKFAVRFYRKDKQGKYQYILNTEEALLPIKGGLDIVNPAIEEDSVDLFGDFVKNSMNPSFALPEQAFFTKPGINLPGTAAIDYETDTLVLKAQAVANDLGYISYVWKYKSDIEDSEWAIIENDSTYAVASDVPVLVTDMVKEVIAETGDASKFVPLLDENGAEVKDDEGNVVYTIAKREGGQKYFVPVTKADGETGYQLYLDRIDEENPTPANLVELITTLTLKPVDEGGSEFVTGEYQVEATNTIYLDHTDPEGFRNTTPVAFSDKCIVPGPAAVELSKQFAKHAFIKDVAGVELKVEVKEDKTNPDYFYTWYNYPREDGDNSIPVKIEDMTKIENLGTNTYAVTTPGWYAAEVSAILNRKTMSATTDICRLTGYPAKPNILKLEYAPISFNEEGVELPDAEMAWSELKSENDAEASEAEKNMSTNWRNGDLIRLRVNTDIDDKVDYLNSDKLLYSWYVQLPDEPKRLITSADIGLNSIVREGTKIDGKTLDIRCLHNTTEEKQAAVYSCVITNQLGEGEKSLSEPCDTSKYNTFVVM